MKPIERFVPWFLFAAAVLSLSYLGLIEFQRRADMPLNIDEFFFAACAARGLASGHVPISGCTDTKGPLVYVVYQLLQDAASPYRLGHFKAASFGVGLVLSAACAGVAYRASGIYGALLGAGLVIELFVIDPGFLALKPELIGTAIYVVALLLAGSTKTPMGSWRLFLVGCLLGVCLTAKQTFIFPAIALMCWLMLARERPVLESATRKAWHASVLLLGLCLPALIFYVVFFFQDRAEDYLASLFLYPSLYKLSDAPPLFKAVLIRVAETCLNLQSFGLLTVLTVAAICKFFTTTCDERSPAQHLLLWCFGGCLCIVILSPVTLRHHLIPAFVVASLFCAVVLGRVFQTCLHRPLTERALPDSALPATLAAFAVIISLTAWVGPAGNPLRDRDKFPTILVDSRPGEFAYVVGVFPKFYVDNRLLPSSDILYPSALPGAPKMWAYVPPDAGSFAGRFLMRNVGRLQQDFERTPPAHVLVLDLDGRAPNSPKITDIDYLNAYILANCEMRRRIDNPKQPALVFTCRRPS